jgi:hypothetical protein
MADYVLTDAAVFDIDFNIEIGGHSTLGYEPDVTPTGWALSPVKVFDLVVEGGGGAERPTSGFLYPRGQD